MRTTPAARAGHRARGPAASISAAAGQLLGGAFALLQRVRHPRPIHPHGVALVGTLRFLTDAAPSGLDIFDSPPAAELAVTARVSRSLGVPAPLPDVIGLALRLGLADGPADVAFASTGFGVPSRFALAPQRSPSRARFTTLFPYRTLRGPVLLGALTIEPDDLPIEAPALATALERTTWRLRLHHASPGSKWHPFAVLELGHEPGRQDAADRYDPVLRPLPGSASYGWARRLREPSYARVQGRSS